jgi:hypothetical protein
MGVRFVMVLPVLALAGCGAPPALTYKGRPAQTAAECEAAHKDAKGSVPVVYGGGVPVAATLAGVVIGASINADRRQTQYEACLQSVGKTDSGAAGYSAVPLASPSQSGVPSCSLKMVGGTGYACAAD